MGGTVFTRNSPHGYYTRSRYKDSGASIAQSAWRFKYSTVDLFYKTLTHEQKESWKRITYGKGQTRYSTFMKVNLKRIARGLSLIKTPPY